MEKLSEDAGQCPAGAIPRIDVIGGYVRRYWDMVALARRRRPCKVIGETGIIRDKPGFEVDHDHAGLGHSGPPKSHDRPGVLMPVTGYWRITWEDGEAVLAPGDTMSVPEGPAL